jgi:hypothetical protein
MERREWIDPVNHRKYQVLGDGDGNHIIVGPPEGLVETLGLTEPFATTLHNILYDRGMFNFTIVARNSKNLVGALQEALNLDVQRLTEAFFNYEKEVVHE